jgi:hypothetical protein
MQDNLPQDSPIRKLPGRGEANLGLVQMLDVIQEEAPIACKKVAWPPSSARLGSQGPARGSPLPA